MTTPYEAIRMRWLDRGRHLTISLLFAFTASVAGPVALAQITPLNDAEQFVLQQLKIRGVADLEKSTLKDKTIHHAFLEDLITSPQPLPSVASRGLELIGATIDGPLSMGNVTIPFPLTFIDCTLDQGFDLSSNIFSRDFLLNGSYVGTRLGSSSSSDKEPLASFIGSKFAGRVSLDRTYFYNGVDFTNAEIDGTLESDGVHFESADDEADFNNVKVGAQASFQQSWFKGGLDLTDAALAKLFIAGFAAGGSPPQEPSGPINLLIDHAHISNGLGLQNLTLSGFGARLTNVQGETVIENVVPTGLAFFSGGQFQALTIKGFDQWLKDAANFRLDGISFDSLDLPDSQKKPPEKDMLALINQSPYSPQPYQQLETFLRSHGNPDFADQVYFSMRRKERERLSRFRAYLDWVQDWLLGYGRELRKAAVLVIALVCVGALLFRRNHMEPEDKHSTDSWYNPFWFSLDLLSPIDLGVASRWRAKDPLLRNYAQIHRVTGWILIPLIVAAISGIIK